MKGIIRKDEEAVSPVIATILMVAITVVLAAVLYVMVSGLITSPGSTPKQVGAAITSSGGNWIVTFTSVPAGMANSTVLLSVTTTAGVSTNVSSMALNSFLTTSHGIKYQPATKDVNIAAADTILISQSWWPSGNRITLTSSGSIVYGPQTLQ